MRLGWPVEAAAEVVPHMDWAARHTPAAYLQQQQITTEQPDGMMETVNKHLSASRPATMNFCIADMRSSHHLGEEARHSPAEVPRSQAVAAEAAHSPEAGRSPAEGRHTAVRRRR